MAGRHPLQPRDKAPSRSKTLKGTTACRRAMRGPQILIVLFLFASLSGCVSGNDDDTDDDTNTMDPSDNGDNNTTAPPEVVDLSVSLSGAYPATIAYDPATLSAPANSTVNLTFTNTDQNPLISHDWVLEGVEGAATDVIGNGETSTVSFAAPAVGTYVFFCSVPGHRDNGMEGEFTVAA